MLALVYQHAQSKPVVKVEVCSRGAQDEAPKAPRTRRHRRRGGGEYDNEFGAFYLSQNPSGGRKIQSVY